MPEPREQRIADAVAAFLDRQARDEPADIQSFCREHPDIAPDLRTELETVAAIDRVLAPAGPDGSLPERLSGHRILAEIGAGGMGRVLLALDESLGRKVAIKTLHPRFERNAALRGRFLREARSLARVSHPHIVRIYNLGQAGEPPHFVMEYLEGVSLTQAARPLPIRQKIELLHKVVRAVEFLHDHALIHRDLKPGNILVGADLEPKLLDLGLALPAEDRGARLTVDGEVMGTPQYFSPEQAKGAPLDARSDIFSLGIILYELLTGALPFAGGDAGAQLRSIAGQDPALPRRLNPDVPGELQNICLKALEKDPGARYASAVELARDLERYLAGEPVLAAPTAYGRLMAGKIEQHLRELDAWKHDQVLSDAEYDALRKGYDRLAEREDAWIMESRRLSLPQVSLYLGAWLLAVGAALVALFRHAGLSGTPAVLLVAAAAAPAAWLGLRRWTAGELRIAIAYLLAFCLLLPLGLLVLLNQYGLAAAPSRGDEKLELFSKFASLSRVTNAQIWWALLLAMPAYGWLRRFTRASVFSLVFAVAAALLCLTTLLRMGMLRWIDEDPGKPYFHLLPFALLFLLAGIGLERLRFPSDSRYFYPIAVAFTLAGLSGVVLFHEPYAHWLKAAAPWTRGQLEYLFLVNAATYFLLQAVGDRFRSPQLRIVARAFRFVLPGHVLTSLLLLGLAASDRWTAAPGNPGLRFEARIFELLLPAAAAGFVFASIPKQMKNFFAWGLVFLAIGAVRLEQDLFRERALWPAGLLLAGFLLTLAASRYARLRMMLRNWNR